MAQENTTTMTVRLSSKTKQRLEQAAKNERRSKSFLAAEAIEYMLAVKEAQDKGVRKALASLDKKGGIPHEKVKAWVESWDTDNELPRPTV